MRDHSVIHVAVASDSRYLSGAIGTLASIRLAVPPEIGIEVIFLHDGLTAAEQKRLRTAMEKLKSAPKIEFMKMEACLDGFPEFRNSNMTYARLELPGRVSVERLFYIDVDIMVTQNLNELSDLELPENGIGGVSENRMSADMPKNFPVPLDPDLPYINAGFLLLDLNKIRNNKTFQRAAEILREFPESCKLHDQSAINYVLNGKAALIDASWNTQTKHILFDPITAMKPLADRAMNVHFINKGKPWTTCAPFAADQMFRLLLDAVDPQWRNDPHVKKAIRRSKERFSRFMPHLFRTRGRVRKLLGKSGHWDFREADVWASYNKNLRRLRRSHQECQSLLHGWQEQIRRALV